ncbi:hypothetical protein C2G38_2177775 [Gigaspora rosea]|uniref:Uncharacterized protein n=1 Tax=Gigaspora rosea TaxID=44941 RepID=A0A397VGT1_9GLOM|nr:hypothetical protein C2G38_2177775 [Gigaspora rosea]
MDLRLLLLVVLVEVEINLWVFNNVVVAFGRTITLANYIYVILRKILWSVIL